MIHSLALELRSVSRRFGSVAALDDATLLVREGTVHALLGENGAGKTTLMRIAFGMLQPDRGSVMVKGTRRHFRSPSDAIMAGIGMVQQHPANVPAMKVWENVQLGGGGRLHPRRAREQIKSLSQDIGFALDPDAVVSELSVAAQQRLEILKAISRHARMLILDEPTAILAPEEARDLYNWLRIFAKGGGTAVIITHKLEEARRFTDDVTVLRAGRSVLAVASPGVSADELTTAMIGETLSAEPSPTKSPGATDVVVRAIDLTLRDERRVPVVEQATFVVHAGEIVGIAGVEGSGHHQLLLAIAGRHPVASGTLTAPPNTGLVPEDRHRDGAVLDFTLAENIALHQAGERRGRLDWRSVEARTSALLSQYDVRARGATERFALLSGGNQQKLVLARELDGPPSLLVVENPTRGLDVRAAAFVRRQLRAARDEGTAIVFYSSDLDEIVEMSDRVLVVFAGSVSAAPRDRGRIGAAMLGAAQ